ncbi:hypothetical protein BH11BAC7_BH11BAC7_34470 [soil metagenome]
MEYNGEHKPVNKFLPLVSVCILTYQHQKYIAECIEGALKQKTSFPVEILIGEDESDDGTREICKTYAEKYPDRIRLFLRSRKDVIKINGSNTGRFNLLETTKAARGKYLALCEGDDFWSDPLKLQKQIDFLEANADFAVCFHAAYEMHEGKENRISNASLSKEVFTIEDLAKGNFLHTPTVVYRNVYKGVFPSWFNRIPVGDYPLHLLHSNYGKIKFIPEPLAHYRVQQSGAWSGLNKRESYLKKINVLAVLQEADFNEEVKKLLADQQRKAINELLEIELDSNWNNFVLDLKNFAENDEQLCKIWLSNSSATQNKNAPSSGWRNKFRKIFKR